MPPKISHNDCGVTEMERFEGFAGRGVFHRSFPAQANSHLEQMDAAALAAATDGFSDARLLGRGGFGAVYRGELEDGRVVAIDMWSGCCRGSPRS